ncbi:hypothetical protein [Dyella silvatica]|uniref:hypothetical protein n=1 Tax=Dyella silvatica TaxID=2992128 RepID=UPI002254F6B9|nr:hypothetical protein [Dyella silvatica]
MMIQDDDADLIATGERRRVIPIPGSGVGLRWHGNSIFVAAEGWKRRYVRMGQRLFIM